MDGWGVAEEGGISDESQWLVGWLVGIIVRRMRMVAFARQGVSE